MSSTQTVIAERSGTPATVEVGDIQATVLRPHPSDR